MRRILTLLIVSYLAFFPSLSLADSQRIGVGVNYWSTIDEIETDEGEIDRDGFSIVASYQYWPALLGLEVDLEFLPDRFGETAVAPAAYVLVGKAIYAGAGIGTTFADGEFADEPFLALKAGLDLELLPHIYGEVYANYRFNDRAELDNADTDIDTDTVFFGAALRISF